MSNDEYTLLFIYIYVSFKIYYITSCTNNFRAKQAMFLQYHVDNKKINRVFSQFINVQTMI